MNDTWGPLDVTVFFFSWLPSSSTNKIIICDHLTTFSGPNVLSGRNESLDEHLAGPGDSGLGSRELSLELEKTHTFANQDIIFRRFLYCWTSRNASRM
jgi:hypothetical protein